MENLTVIIPYRNGQATIGRLLACLPADLRLSAIIVDDASETPPDVSARVIRLHERGYFSGAVNAGIAACDTDVLVLNQDIWFEGDKWLGQIASWQAEGFAIAGDGVMGHPAWPHGYVQGTCMYLSRDAIHAVGSFNERDYPLWGATAEWQLRACRAGFKANPCQVAGMKHERQGNFGAAMTAALRAEPEKQALFVRTPPAISVIMPCYNYGKYLPDAINSLVGGKTCLGQMPPQTFQSFEVVIVDDASTDDSWKIAQSLADEWRGIRAIRNKQNLGTAETVNTGIKASYGKAITFLSADDMMESTRLERLYRVLESNQHSVVYDNLMMFKNGERVGQFGEKFGLGQYNFERLLYKNCMHAGILYTRQAWSDVGGYPAIMRDGREDWAFNVALGIHGYCGILVDEPLYLYRREGQNRSVKNVSVQWYQTYVSRMKALYPKIYAGERPEMCCGRKAKAKTTATAKATSAGARTMDVPLVGSEGMVLLEYTGAKAGKTLYGGRKSPSRQAYTFGGNHRLGYVDKRDVDYLMAQIENGKHVFRHSVPITQTPAVLAPQPEPEPIAQPEPERKVMDAAPVVEAPPAEQPAEAKPKRSRKKSEKTE